MNTQKVDFVKSAANKKAFLRDGRHAVAFAGRSNVGIYYKGLEFEEQFSSPEHIARDWEGSYLITEENSAYSTMALQSDGSIGFLYEECTYFRSWTGYTIVYKGLGVEEISAGKYSLRN